MRIQDLKDKKVGIWGLGAEGWSTLKLLRKKFPATIFTLLNDTHFSEEMEQTLKQDPFLELVIGEEIDKKASSLDVIIKSPGVSFYKEPIQNALKNGVYFTSATKLWFAEHQNDTTVCITGTKGKSTTSSLVTHFLRNAGKRVTLGGNIGTPMLDMFDVEPKPEIWVMELSSYQLTDFEGCSPTVALLLNLFPEHLDWHKGVENYYKDKTNVFSYQKDNSFAVINKIDKNTNLYLKPENLKNPVYFNDKNGFYVEDGYVCYQDKKLLHASEVPIPGEHNLSNICAALTVVKSLGIDFEKCYKSVSSFKGLPHRLYPCGKIDNKLFIDDSISTTPQSAVAAMETHKDKKITILLGGFDRGLDFSELAEYVINKNIHAVITMPDNGVRIAEEIKTRLSKSNATTILKESSSLEEAVKLAKEITPENGVVILSPGSPSYGKFKNFAERGDFFAKYAGF
ncbi:MAG: UDP-N-acetylmuramoyl-L-alanine--D-glutamate ligase [Candidatus Sericytochromatia bacterium]